jgi:uncharacterized protein (DUF488 family)
MYKRENMTAAPIYTIGYGARDLEELLSALKANHIQYLLDVRTNPYSSYKPEFSKNALKIFLEANDVRYLFVGDSLGGQPADQSCYTDGKVDYEKVSQKQFYRAGIERLHKASKIGQRVVLMCSEGKPENCHRSKLIGKTLTNDGIEVLHIDEHDVVITQKDVLLRLTGGQPSLFGDDFFKFTSRKRYQEDTDESE